MIGRRGGRGVAGALGTARARRRRLQLARVVVHGAGTAPRVLDPGDPAARAALEAARALISAAQSGSGA